MGSWRVGGVAGQVGVDGHIRRQPPASLPAQCWVGRGWRPERLGRQLAYSGARPLGCYRDHPHGPRPISTAYARSAGPRR
eukprot:1629773-Alexandrium_andersonii.AAC.1